MAWSRPTIVELQREMEADYLAEIARGDDTPTSRVILPRGMRRARINALLAAIHDLNGILARAALNHVLDTAELPELERIGELWGVPRLEAVSMAYTAQFEQSSQNFSLGDLVRDWRGALYIVTDASGLAPYPIAIAAQIPGRAYVLLDGARIDAVDTPVGVVEGTGYIWQEIPNVAAGVYGRDIEEIEAYRRRIRAQVVGPPRPGRAEDLETWILDAVAGPLNPVRVHVVPPAANSQIVNVYLTGVSPVGGATDPNNVLPSPGTAAAAQTAVDAAYHRNLGANITVADATPYDIDMTFTALDPNTTDVQEAIENAVAEYLARQVDVGGTVAMNDLDAAISLATGIEDYTRTVPASDVNLAEGEVARVGTTTWPP